MIDRDIEEIMEQQAQENALGSAFELPEGQEDDLDEILRVIDLRTQGHPDDWPDDEEFEKRRENDSII